MNLQLAPGRYVVAVSGGVDSIALLNMLQQLPNIRLTVAHYDHGIRPDAEQDRLLVQRKAREYGLPFVFNTGNLGPDASEATARQARYVFLRQIRKLTQAQAIITAHHQDDLLETAILNMIRGTGRKGLTAIAAESDIKRPLLHVPKSELLDYAIRHQLQWHEDSTNQNPKYLRNYVRQTIVPQLGNRGRASLLASIEELRSVNQQLDTALINHLHHQSTGHSLDRQQFIQLPHAIALEVLATWLREHQVGSFDRKGLERLVVGIKTGRPGTQLDVTANCHIAIYVHTLALRLAER